MELSTLLDKETRMMFCNSSYYVTSVKLDIPLLTIDHEVETLLELFGRILHWFKVICGDIPLELFIFIIGSTVPCFPERGELILSIHGRVFTLLIRCILCVRALVINHFC